MKKVVACFIIASFLTGCSSSKSVSNDQASHRDGPPVKDIDVSKIPDAVPQVEAMSPYGNFPSYQVDGKTYHVLTSAKGYNEVGTASWYGTKFNKQRTSSGEPYDLYGMTAASKTLPLPTYVRVTNLKNNKQIIVKVNDRGPFHEGRIIDLSYTAAKKLDILDKGTGLVRVEALAPASDATNELATQQNPLGLYIQIASFASKQNAQQIADNIAQQLDVPVMVSDPHANQPQPRYRVLAGPINEAQDSSQLMSKLKQLGYSHTFKTLAPVHLAENPITT